MSNLFGCVGRLGKDSVVREAGTTNVLSFTIANNTGYGNNEQTIWLSCSLFGANVGNRQPHLTKGKEVFVSGELSTREYEGKTYLELRCNNIDFVGGGKREDAQPVNSEDVPF